MFFVHEWNLATDNRCFRMSWQNVFHLTGHSQVPKCRWCILETSRSYSQSFLVIWLYFPMRQMFCLLISMCAAMLGEQCCEMPRLAYQVTLPLSAEIPEVQHWQTSSLLFLQPSPTSASLLYQPTHFQLFLFQAVVKTMFLLVTSLLGFAYWCGFICLLTILMRS